MDRTTWLDGLRGIAAAIVATDHFFMGEVLDYGFLSFWTDPPEANRRLMQLPPFRLLFAAHAMVSLFLVISGYAISINLLRYRNSDDGVFLRRLASAVSKRIIRIYLPVFVITVMSQIIYFCNLYQWDFGDEVLRGTKPWTAPWSHITFIFRYMLDITNIIGFPDNDGLNGQLWTMPMEFRGSCVVYITILGLAFWRPHLRRIALACLISYFFYFGYWDLAGFLAGLYVAEGQQHSRPNSEEEFKLYFHTRGNWTSRLKFIDFASTWNYFCFLFGLYLVCLSDDGELPPGYQFLKLVESSRWDNNWEVLSRCWKTAGSALMVYGISQLPRFQRPLNSRPIQYLGKVSFSLYLVHQSVYHLVRDPLRNSLWYISTKQGYPGKWEAGKYTVPLAFTWLVGYAILVVINLSAAHLYTKYVDQRCVDMAKRFDKWLTRH